MLKVIRTQEKQPIALENRTYIHYLNKKAVEMSTQNAQSAVKGIVSSESSEEYFIYFEHQFISVFLILIQCIAFSLEF